MINIGMISLGCSKNTVDSEAILSVFSSSKDYKIVNNIEDADCIIINTCGFIEAAKKEAIENILDCIKYQNKKIVVCGCLVERYIKELKEEIPEVSAWLTFKDYIHIGEIVANLFNLKNDVEFDIFNRVLSTSKFTAYLKISEGCSNYCGFCAIPLIRGKFHSFDYDSLIKEAKELAASGVKELVIISQDTLRYGSDFTDKSKNLLSLLKEIEKIEGIEFIRLLYLYPEELTDELIDFINNSKKMTHYFDIPIQHVSNKVLKNMLRRDTKESISALLDRIKEKVSDPIFRTTLITGYPSETMEDIEELKEFINKYHFNHLGVFTYSLEEGTYGATFKDQISEEEKEKRKEIIMNEQKKISYIENKKLIGKVYKAIIIKKGRNNEYFVRCGINAIDDIDGQILLKTNKIHELGDIIYIRIKEAFVYDLIAEEEEGEN